MKGLFVVVQVGSQECTSEDEVYRDYKQQGAVITSKTKGAKGRNYICRTAQELYQFMWGCLIGTVALGHTVWALPKRSPAGKKIGA